ncbi:MAG: fibronectin type III domain-containing protein, partial [Candidatus Sungbacteria bacterium]|nr:fibronectin type III domain-containing protein [Candidatus Sungbacteria bacterium]
VPSVSSEIPPSLSEATPPELTRSLSRGSSGDDVRKLQEFLARDKDIYPEGLLTGFFGPLTEAAVKKWQEKHGVESVGIVGPKTIAKFQDIGRGVVQGLIQQGAGASGVIPPGLLKAPGIQKKLEISTTTTSIATTTTPVTATTTAPIIVATTTQATTPVEIIPAIPVQPAPLSSPLPPLPLEKKVSGESSGGPPAIIPNGSGYGIVWVDTAGTGIRFAAVNWSGDIVIAPRTIYSPGSSLWKYIAIKWTGTEYGISVAVNEPSGTQTYLVRVNAQGGFISSSNLGPGGKSPYSGPALTWDGNQYDIAWNAATNNGVHFARYSPAQSAVVTTKLPSVSFSQACDVAIEWNGDRFGVMCDGSTFFALDVNGNIVVSPMPMSCVKDSVAGFAWQPSIIWDGEEFQVISQDHWTPGSYSWYGTPTGAILPNWTNSNCYGNSNAVSYPVYHSSMTFAPNVYDKMTFVSSSQIYQRTGEKNHAIGFVRLDQGTIKLGEYIKQTNNIVITSSLKDIATSVGMLGNIVWGGNRYAVVWSNANGINITFALFDIRYRPPQEYCSNPVYPCWEFGFSLSTFTQPVIIPDAPAVTTAIPATPAAPATPAVPVTIATTITTSSDTTPPSVPTNLVATFISSSQITFFWASSTDNVGVAGYKVYRSGSYLASVTSTSYTGLGLTAGTSYSFTVAAYDAAGNVSAQSSPISVTTASTATTTIDTTSPVVSNVTVTNITSNSATFTWTTNEPGNSYVNYGLTYGPFGDFENTTAVDTVLVTLHSVSVSNLQPGTTYNYRVKSSDAAGNIGTYPGQFITTSAVTSDTTPPVISNIYTIGGTDYASTSISIIWTTNEVADSQAEYGLTTSYGSNTSLNTSMVNSHAVTLSQLQSNTTYYFRVKSKDAAGNLATATGSFTTTLVATTATTTTTTTAPAAASLTIITPNGGESWQVGTGPTIRFSFSYSDYYIHEGAAIYLQTVDGSSRQTLLQIGSINIVAGENHYVWAIPSSVAPGNNYGIKVAITIGSTTAEDVSDQTFSIAAAPASVSSTPDIRTGTGVVADSKNFNFGTGSIFYSVSGPGTSGYLYSGGSTGWTTPPMFLAGGTQAGSTCSPNVPSQKSYQGISNICQFTSASNYTFNDEYSVLMFDKQSSCYRGILLFKQGNYYGGIDPEDISGNNLNYRYWYDASGGSNFSSLCSASAKKESDMAAILKSLSSVLQKLQQALR